MEIKMVTVETLALALGPVEQELLIRNEYLGIENQNSKVEYLSRMKKALVWQGPQKIKDRTQYI